MLRFKLLRLFLVLLPAVALAAPSDWATRINLPACDGAANVKHIQNDSDWSDINNNTFDIFCVYPGTYTGLSRITINESGTANNKKWLRWYDPNNPTDTTTHPWQMANGDRAIIDSLEVNGAHWMIDRLYAVGSLNYSINGGDTVLNKIVVVGLPRTAFEIRSSDVTLQYSVIGDAVQSGGNDRHAVYIGHSSGPARARIVGNEFFDVTDGLQIGPDAGGEHVISGNVVYDNTDFYTDCSGNFNPAGNCSCGENAFDFKGPGLNDGTWTLIEHNFIHGKKVGDGTCGSTSKSYASINFSSSALDSNYIILSRNVTYSAGLGGSYHGLDSTKIYYLENVLHLGQADNHPEISAWSYGGAGADYIMYESNTVVGVPQPWMKTYSSTMTNSRIRCNAVLNSGQMAGFNGSGHVSSSVVDNYYYNTPATQHGTPDRTKTYGTSAEANNTDLVMASHPITNPGATITIPDVKPTISSPHYGCINWMGL